MGKEIIITIILAILLIPAGILGVTMPQLRSKILSISSAAAIIVILVLLGLFSSNLLSVDIVLNSSIAVTVVVILILIIVAVKSRHTSISVSGLRELTKEDVIVAIKSDLTNMNIIERQKATEKAQHLCLADIAGHIIDDLSALFGMGVTTNSPLNIADIKKKASEIPLIQRAIVNNDRGALVEYFKKWGGAFDSNKFGLKMILSLDDNYELARANLAQDRVKLKVRVSEEKNKIIQDNIDRVKDLSYGLNSFILLRSVLKSAPEQKQEKVPPETRIILESAEAISEKFLRIALDDLEKDWSKLGKRRFLWWKI